MHILSSLAVLVLLGRVDPPSHTSAQQLGEGAHHPREQQQQAGRRREVGHGGVGGGRGLLMLG